MSTGLECAYVEAEPGKWYWLLETNSGNRFDWLSDAQVYGPFRSQEAAHDHLHSRNANPGGYIEISYDPSRPLHQGYVEAIKRAKSPKSQNNSFRYPWR